MTIHRKPSGLIHICQLSSVGEELIRFCRFPCAGSCQAKIKVSVSLSASVGGSWGSMCFQAHSGHWQNSVPCSRRIEVSTSLLALGVASNFQRLPAFLGSWPLPSLSQQLRVECPSFFWLSLALFLHLSDSSQRGFSVFKASCDWIICGDSLLILRCITLTTAAEFLLSCSITYS